MICYLIPTCITCIKQEALLKSYPNPAINVRYISMETAKKSKHTFPLWKKGRANYEGILVCKNSTSLPILFDKKVKNTNSEPKLIKGKIKPLPDPKLIKGKIKPLPDPKLIKGKIKSQQSVKKLNKGKKKLSIEKLADGSQIVSIKKSSPFVQLFYNTLLLILYQYNFL